MEVQNVILCNDMAISQLYRITLDFFQTTFYIFYFLIL